MVHTRRHLPEAGIVVSGVHERSFIRRVHWVVSKKRVRLSINDLVSTLRYTIPWSLVLDQPAWLINSTTTATRPGTISSENPITALSLPLSTIQSIFGVYGLPILPTWPTGSDTTTGAITHTGLLALSVERVGLPLPARACAWEESLHTAV